jgi:hypothetical protein
MYRDACHCPRYHSQNTCEVCPIYREHIENLKEFSRLDPDRNKKKLSMLFGHFQPIYNDYIKPGREILPVERRKKRMIEKLTLQMLRFLNGNQSKMERQLWELFENIYGSANGSAC